MLNIKDTQKYKLYTKDEWLFVSSDKKYVTKLTFINNNIVHLEINGFVDINNMTEMWPQIEAVIKEHLKDQKYFLIHNYKDLRSATNDARMDYFKWIEDNLESIEAIYFYNVSTFFKVLIQAGKILSNRVNNIFILNDIEEILIDIDLTLKKSSVERQNTH